MDTMNFDSLIFYGLKNAPVLELSCSEYSRAFEEKVKSVENWEHIAIARLKVDSATVSGDVVKYEQWTFVNADTPLKFTCEYSCENVIPRTAHIKQCVDRTCRKATIIFLPGGGKSTLEVPFKVQKPGKVSFYAYGGFHRLFMRKLVSAVKTFGILDCSPKPTSEYPVQNAYNTTLDIIPEFKEGAQIYPHKTSYVDFRNLQLKIIKGAFKHNGKIYGIYDSKNCYTLIRCSYEVKANTNVEIENWSTLLTVLYADKKHVSQVKINTQQEGAALRTGQTATISFEVPVPHWAYGYVNIASAINVYHGGMYVYGGGPMWNFHLCRGLVP